MRINRLTLFLVCILVSLFHQAILSQERGVKNSILRYPQNGQINEVKLYDNSYALVIGMSKYQHWKPLPGPVKDTEEVKAVLKEHGFEVQVALDLTGKELDARIDQFIEDYGLNNNNRLIIYFAGHGETLTANDKRETGYIVPIDAPLSENNETEFKRIALSMDKIKYYATKIETKHALFVFDSCFSGQLFANRDGKIVPPSIGEYLDNAARQFITSGTSKQKVPDESSFRGFFVSGLRGDADLDQDGYITASELAKYLYKKVTDKSSGYQTPQYGGSLDANLDKGDMVFFLTDNSANLPEEEAWLKAKTANSVQSYTVFLNNHRNGKYYQDCLNLLLEASNKAHPPKEQDKVSGQAVTQRNSAPKIIPFEFTTLYLNPNGIELDKTKLTGDSFEEDLGGDVKLKLVRIPQGRFKMGSDGNKIDEKPIHEVVIGYEFYMGVFEVTRKQWEMVAKLPKIKIKISKGQGTNEVDDNLPVVGITWEEVEEFCKRLSKLTGRIYTLPSESEWEYAAKAGTETPFYFGSTIKSDIVNFNAGVDSKEGIKGRNRGMVIEVGSLGVANKFGLFDMYGNVAEWCLDGWADTYEKALNDGTARPGSPERKVIRGGSYALSASSLCSTCRDVAEVDAGSEQLGFRVVMKSPIANK